jgi:Putative GTPase activating protein for Arf/Regulator of G protein signaling domain/Ankyrin repeats (3 copies)
MLNEGLLVAQIRPRNNCNECLDCRAPNPEWVIGSLGALVCVQCANIHYQVLGNQTVKCFVVDEVPNAEARLIQKLGNKSANEILEHGSPAEMGFPGQFPYDDDSCGAETEARQDMWDRATRSVDPRRLQKERWISLKHQRHLFLQPLNEEMTATPELQFEEVLGKSDERNFLIQFLDKEFALENMHFWLALEGIRDGVQKARAELRWTPYEDNAEEDPPLPPREWKEFEAKLKALFTRFISKSAPEPVNIPETLQRNINGAMKAATGAEAHEAILFAPFSKAQSSVALTMKADKWMRFKQSPEYEALIQQKRQDGLGRALRQAVVDDDISLALLLILHHANLNYSDGAHDKETPMHAAARFGRIECMRLLLFHGASLEVVDGGGRTPLETAEESGAEARAEIVMLLITEGSRRQLQLLEESSARAMPAMGTTRKKLRHRHSSIKLTEDQNLFDYSEERVGDVTDADLVADTEAVTFSNGDQYQGTFDNDGEFSGIGKCKSCPPFVVVPWLCPLTLLVQTRIRTVTCMKASSLGGNLREMGF